MDGCFLRGVCKGQVLTATGKDGNNKMFPIAWAVVDVENHMNWRWFIDSLKIALGFTDGDGITIVSDLQKGLGKAVDEALPAAEHRWCARHIYALWCKKWSGGELRKKFWIAAWSTYEEEFIDNLKSLALEHGQQAVDDLVKYNPQKWCKAYCSTRCSCDMVENNISECFNAWINESRDKSIISLLEDIRRKCMTKIVDGRAHVSKWKSEWSPECLAIYEVNFRLSIDCEVLFHGDDGFEVRQGGDQHCIVVERRTCTCRGWDITGIPCAHAICAIVHIKKDPKHFISNWYSKTVFVNAYKFSLQPVRGYKFWRLSEFVPMEPPAHIPRPGRPRVKRIRESWETRQNARYGKVTRKGLQITCGKCGKVGHNKKGCKTAASDTQNTDQFQKEFDLNESQGPSLSQVKNNTP